MKTATGLTLIAIGAILAFAVTANAWFFNVNVAGYVIMLTGLRPVHPAAELQQAQPAAGAASYPDLAERNGRGNPETTVPPYVVTNPVDETQQAGLPGVPSIPPDPTVRSVMTPGAGQPGAAGQRGGEDSEIIEQLRDD